MKFSLADKLGLIYTAAGSQRKVASVVGLSHQTVGRILHAQMQGRDISNYEKRVDLMRLVDRGFASHVALAKAEAKRGGIPFTSALPVYVQRMEKRADGKPSDRTKLEHAHWLSDRIRNAWLKFSKSSGRYIGATVRSVVNRRAYGKQADKRAKKLQLGRTQEATFYREQMKAQQLKDGRETTPVYTPITRFDASYPDSLALADLNEKLRNRHQPATGDVGTKYADTIIMQFDTRTHATKQSKARSASKGARRTTRKT